MFGNKTIDTSTLTSICNIGSLAASFSQLKYRQVKPLLLNLYVPSFKRLRQPSVVLVVTEHNGNDLTERAPLYYYSNG